MWKIMFHKFRLVPISLLLVIFLVMPTIAGTASQSDQLGQQVATTTGALALLSQPDLSITLPQTPAVNTASPPINVGSSQTSELVALRPDYTLESALAPDKEMLTHPLLL